MTPVSSLVRTCALVLAGGLAGAAVLLALGVPSAVLIGLAPFVICLAMHPLMMHGAAHRPSPPEPDPTPDGAVPSHRPLT